MESDLNNFSIFDNDSLIDLLSVSNSINLNEDPDLLSSQKKELEEIIQKAPNRLSVVLIKISQLNNYELMDIDTLYQKVLPVFPLLRRNNSSKYQSNSLSVVRSAIVSNKLYIKTLKENMH